jgi:hypothetical protein
MVALPVIVLPGVTLLMPDELLLPALEIENELGASVRTTASGAHRIAKDKICD